MSILVVEDEPLIAVDIASTFRSEGATVVVAHNCKEAIQALTNKPSIAVLDIIQDGELDKLKELLKAAGIRYLTYSGYTPTEETTGLHIVKPAPGPALVDAVKRLSVQSR